MVPDPVVFWQLFEIFFTDLDGSGSGYVPLHVYLRRDGFRLLSPAQKWRAEKICFKSVNSIMQFFGYELLCIRSVNSIWQLLVMNYKKSCQFIYSKSVHKYGQDLDQQLIRPNMSFFAQKVKRPAIQYILERKSKYNIYFTYFNFQP